MRNSTRSLLQASYTPKSSAARVSDKGTRGMEKCAFISHLMLSDNELDKLTKLYKADKSSESKDALKVLAMIKSAIEKDTFQIHCAKLTAEIDSDILTLIAGDLIGLRKKELEELEHACKKILENKKLPFDINHECAKKILDWAIRNGIETETAKRIIELALSLRVDLVRLTFEQAFRLARRRLASLSLVQHGFQESMDREPVGYLHLERLSFTPAGIENGELVYSVPLSPGEEVNITHREWSLTTEEFERIVSDSMEEFSELGVTEKSELAQSVSSQTQHSTAFNTGVTASGGFGGVTISTSVGLNASDSSNNSIELSRNHSVDLTRKASSRAKKEHKMSFKVASAAETEDQTVQRIKNPFPDRATRVDYFQMIRKWQVELYRYGIRLTWDITIPEPGSGLLSKLKEIDYIHEELEVDFEEAFPLKPEKIRLDNYQDHASSYGVPVQEQTREAEFVFAPPPDHHNWEPRCPSFTDSYVFYIEIPEGYEVKDNVTLNYIPEPCNPNAGWNIDVWSDYGDRLYFNDRGTIQNHIPVYEKWKGRTGKLFVVVRPYNVKRWHMPILMTVKLRDNVYKAWQQRIWETIRNGFQAQYYERRQMLKDKLARLEEELGDDALSLRKREREEVMKGVLRWLGIPGFAFFPASYTGEFGLLEEELYGERTGLPSDQTAAEDLLAFGEKIKFLHHAIEWENMLYFLYPYFWCHPVQWDFKKYIDHPDPLHRSFLKAGSARVVLTIRPGFEAAFMAFVNTGDMNQLPPSPYLEIGQEFQNFAHTNYQGIPPANPINNFRPLLHPKQRKAWEDMQDIMQLLERYFEANNGTYPSTQQGLAALIDYTDTEVSAVPGIDPWGNNYVYICPGIHGDYDLSSLGADGIEGGDGENADITNWAEASLIGKWYEYTPTSALDIAFNEGLPAETDGEQQNSGIQDGILGFFKQLLTGTTINWIWRIIIIVILILILLVLLTR